jgi:hypothetical protein
VKTVENAEVTLTGITPLMMSNIRLADPEFELTMEIKKLTAKSGRMTPAEQEQKLLLQCRGSLYEEDGQVIYPCINIMRSFQAGGSGLGSGKNSLGPSVERGVLMAETSVPLRYGVRRKEGALEEVVHSSIGEFMKDARFQDKRVVNGNPTAGKNKAMVLAMRPIFPEWELAITVRVFTDMISKENFERVAEAGGKVGVGGGRRIGMGRYTVQVKWLP